MALTQIESRLTLLARLVDMDGLTAFGGRKRCCMIKKIVRKWLEWYIEREADKLQNRYNKYMNKIEKRDEKLNRLYEKIDRWLKGKND